MKKFITSLVIICIFLNYDLSQYIVFLIILFISIPLFFLNKVHKFDFKIEDLIVFLFILVHLYGIILGLVNNNKLEYVLRNFAGIFLYSAYFIFSFFRLNFFRIVRMIQNGLILYFILILLRVVFDLEIFDNILGTHGGFSSSGQARVFSGFFSSFGLFLGISFYNFESKKYIKFIINLLICILLFIYVASSKGFALILLLNSFIYISLNLKRFLSFLNISLVLVIVLIIYFTLVEFGYFNILTSIFATDDISNIERYGQLYSLINEIKLFGKGVGAVFTNYERSEDFPYAIELVYLNIFHKYGFFAICFILGILFTHYKLWKLYKVSTDRLDVLKLIGLMSYTYAALGNPSLFAPSFVIFHSLTLYYLKYHNEQWFLKFNSTNIS